MCVHARVCVSVCVFFLFWEKNKRIKPKMMSQMSGDERVHTI